MRTIIFSILIMMPFITKGQNLATCDFTLSEDKTTLTFSFTNETKFPSLIFLESMNVNEVYSFCQIKYKEDGTIKYHTLLLGKEVPLVPVKSSETYTFKIDIKPFITNIIEAKCALKYGLVINNKPKILLWSKTIDF